MLTPCPSLAPLIIPGIGGEFMLISGATYKGIDEVKLKVLELLSKIPKKPPIKSRPSLCDMSTKCSNNLTFFAVWRRDKVKRGYLRA